MRVYICGSVRTSLRLRVASSNLQAILVNLGSPTSGRIGTQYVTPLTRSSAIGATYRVGARLSRNGVYMMCCDLEGNFLGRTDLHENGGLMAQIQIVSPDHRMRYVRGTATGPLGEIQFDPNALITMATGTDPVATAFSAYQMIDEGPNTTPLTDEEQQNMGSEGLLKYLQRQVEGAEDMATRLQLTARSAHGMAGLTAIFGRLDIVIN